MKIKSTLKLICISLAVIVVSALTVLYFLPIPPLLAHLSYSRAVYDEKHQLLRLTLSQDEKYRLYMPLQAISPQLISAVLLQEDQHFYHHVGVNPISLFKAGWQSYVL